MSRILITGASGFIGSFLVEKAIEQGMQVWAGVRGSSSREFLMHPDIQFVNLDYQNVEALKQQLLEIRPDYIIHAAAVTKVLTFDDFLKINFQYTVTLIDAIHQSGIVLSKFVFFSSMAAHGGSGEDYSKSAKVNETPHPDTGYGKSKLKAEQYLNSNAKFPYLIIRPTGVYGPREKDYFVFFKTIKSGLEPYIGFKKQILTFVYVSDLVDIAFKCLKSEFSGKTWFVSDGKDYTAEEFAQITKDVLKKKTFKLYVPLVLVRAIAFTNEYIGKITKKISTLNNDKFFVLKERNWRCENTILEDLNYTPQYDLKRGVAEAIEWYKQKKWI